MPVGTIPDIGGGEQDVLRLVFGPVDDDDHRWTDTLPGSMSNLCGPKCVLENHGAGRSRDCIGVMSYDLVDIVPDIALVDGSRIAQL